MTVKILHTADWQIGKGFGGIPGDKGALIREQRFTTVATIAGIAAQRQVDAVLVAGDVFDSQTVADQTLRRLVEALAGFDGPWVLLPGNHDAALAESVWTRLHALGCLPENVHPALTAEPLLLADGRLAVLPAPLRRRHESEDLTAVFDALATPASAIRVGLAHGSVANRLPEEAEQHNRIADDRSQRARLDYLALGDWHGTLRIAERCWYAGTPETDAFRSRDPGHVLLVALPAPGQPPQVETVSTSHYRWHRLDERVSGEADIDALDTRLAELAQPAPCQLVRLTLRGTVSLAQCDALGHLLDRWEARFHYLEVDTRELIAQATETDIAEMGASGFVGAAVDRLQTLHAEPAQADQPHAMAALQRLYAEYRRLEQRG